MKKIAKIKDIFLSVIVCFILFFVGAFFVGCANKYEGMEIKLSTQSVTLQMVDGVSDEVEVIVSIIGDASISRLVDVSTDFSQLNIATTTNDQGDTIIKVSASAVCQNAVVVVKTLEGGKSASFVVDVVVPVQMISESSNLRNFFVIKGQPQNLVSASLVEFQPANTTQKTLEFKLIGASSHAKIENGRLIVDEAFEGDEIIVSATSPYLSGRVVNLTIQVLPALNTQTVEMESITYFQSTLDPVYQSGMENPIPSVIEISNNLVDKQSLEFVLGVNMGEEVEVLPVVKSTGTSSSNIVSFSKGQKIENRDASGKLVSTNFTFILSSPTVSLGQDAVLFEVKFKNYNYSYRTNEIAVEVRDSVNKLQMFVDGSLSNQTEFTVYDVYSGAKGLSLEFNVLPSTVTSEEKRLVLELGVNALNYEYFIEGSDEAINNQFIDGRFEFDGQRKIFVKASSHNELPCEIKIYSKQNPAVKKVLHLKSAAGTTNMAFVNAAETVNLPSGQGTNYIYYLSSNQKQTQKLKFTSDTATLEGLSVSISGQSATVDTLASAEADYFVFSVSSVVGLEGTNVVTLRQANGYYIQAEIRVVYELNESELEFSVPSPQVNSSVGFLEGARASEWQFRAAITNGSSVSLSRQGKGVRAVSYEFYDAVQATSDPIDYENFFETTKDILDTLPFATFSDVIDANFLNLNQIKTKTVGKTWIKALVAGQKIVEGQNLQNEKVYSVENVSIEKYFLIEGFIPVSNLSLSTYAMKLYSQNSVGFEHLDLTTQSTTLNFNDATYQNISWLNVGGVYEVDGHAVYATSLSGDGKTLSITALSTWASDGTQKDSLEFVFTAVVREFNKEYRLALNVTILRAVQVEKILVENANVQDGIYIPLDYSGAEIKRKINATVQLGESGKMPFNTSLVFEFLPYTSSQQDVVSVERSTGLITISGTAQNGTSGILRIAPADRYNSLNQYEAGEEDIAVYIPLTVADGQSRQTAYRITSLSDMTSLAKNDEHLSRLHVVLMNDITLRSDETVNLENFYGGFYGALENSDRQNTITAEKPLFGTLHEGAVVADLNICGTLSASGFICAENNGVIDNVNVISIPQNGDFALISTLNATAYNNAVGGLVAENFGKILNSSFSGQILGSALTNKDYVGALAGKNSGTIENSKVEFCVQGGKDNLAFGHIDAGAATLGGLVGKQEGGSVTKSYVQSYVPLQTAAQVLISTGFVSALIGDAKGGLVDECFAFAQNNSSLYKVLAEDGSESLEQINTVIKNAYVLFKATDAEDYRALYCLNYEVTLYQGDKTIFDNIEFSEVWDLSTPLPTFKSVKAAASPTSISTTFAKNYISTFDEQSGSQALMFVYTVSETLTSIERMNLENKNFYSFSDLFGQEISGLSAFSSNSNVVKVTPSGIILVGAGSAEVTFYSIYNTSLSRVFKIYAACPIEKPQIDVGLNQFLDGYVINLKPSSSMSLGFVVNSSFVLDNRSLEYNLTEYSISFSSPALTGSGMGPFTINAPALNLGKNEIDYSLSVVNTGFDAEINKLLSGLYDGKFTLNLYEGADKLELSVNALSMQPYDEASVEIQIYSDLDVPEEGLSLSLISGQKANEVFDLSLVEYLPENTKYFTGPDMTTSATKDTAKYFVHTFKATFKVKEEARAQTYSGEEFVFSLVAKSSIDNRALYGFELVQKTLTLTLSSQEILSITTNHYDKKDKSAVFDTENQTSYVFYEFDTLSPSSVIAPGGEGMLKLEIYPNYSDYDYLDITYSSSAHEASLMLSLLSSCINPETGVEGFRQSVQGFLPLENGIRILNNGALSQNPITTFFIGTYLPISTNQDVVFELLISAVKGSVSVKQNQFNLIARYVEDATVQILDSYGEKLNAIAKGESAEMLITLPKEQSLSLDRISINGIKKASSQEGEIVFVREAIIEDQYSLTRTYRYSLRCGEEVEVLNNANYVTVEVEISWVVGGRVQKKITSYTLGILDFRISDVALLTDRQDKTTFYSYIGIKSNLNFDFTAQGKLSGTNGTKTDFETFLDNFYYEKLSDINSYGNYVVNVGNSGAASFLKNLYYKNGNKYYPLINSDGTFENNNYFSFTEEDGKIVLTGKRQGEVALRFKMNVQLPAPSHTQLYEITFDFNVHVLPYSDENLPLIIDNEQAFIDALNGEAQDYILMKDLYLTNHTPLSTDSILSLDGNNFTIHIMSWNNQTDGSELNLSLFDEIVSTTTLKNITVNLYHPSQIYVDTTSVTEVNVAGLAQTNSGLVYNCSVVSYKSTSTDGAGGIVLDYGAYVGTSVQTKVAGFVLTNNGFITNSRVGGISIEKITGGIIALETFKISSQGTVSGFVDTNLGTIASSFFSNGTITNTTSGGIETTTSGFVGLNNGSITGSYVRGTGEENFSLTGQGITTSSLSAGFVGTNVGDISDCYSNILLATISNVQGQLQTGRLSAGFVHENRGEIKNAFTASKIENALSTQMAFVGVNDAGKLLNSGKISHSYYYNDSDLEGDEYSSISSSNLNVVRLSQPNDPDKFYGFSFAQSASSVNGVWMSTGYGIDLVSANQIAVSGRYIANQKTDEVTGELVSYNLPYYSGYDYGSIKNPIIIRSAEEFNRVFGGDDARAGTAISAYYNLSQQMVYGNYRLIADINLAQLNPDSTSSVNLASTLMTLSSGTLDGNQMTISGVDITAQTSNMIQSFGLFKALENSATIKNLDVSLVAVSAKQARFVGALVGTVKNSKLIGITVRNQDASNASPVLGNNVVGGVVGLVKGASELKNISVQTLSVKANALATGESQNYNRNLSNLAQVNSGISYSGGIAGVVDIYLEDEKTSQSHKTDTSYSPLSNLKASGEMQVRASTVGGISGWIGPQTNVKDVTFEVGRGLEAKLVAYNFYAGGIVGQSHGNIDMARSEHEATLQKEIENGVSEYYHAPSNQIQRGNVGLFDDTSDGQIISTYVPVAVGGIVGTMTTGQITHSYSKLNVLNQVAKYAGGIVGQIEKVGAPKLERNKVSFFEVYAFGDVGAKAAGGIVGYIDASRILSMAKVNAVNYWGLKEDIKTGEFSLSENVYQIYAKTSSSNGDVFVDQIVNYDKKLNQVKVKDGFSLPEIASTGNNDDMFAITAVKFVKGGQKTNEYIKQSFACLEASAPYNMVFDPYFGLQDSEKTSTDFVSTQAVTPYYDLTDITTNGIAMDTYFIQANWDTSYWVRYTQTNDLLPSLVTYSESMSYYIDVPEDLQKMIYHPYATFIVRALNQPSTIIPVGTYIESTGLTLNNFSGTLKGLEANKNYGFDFEYKNSFIQTTTGASFYNLAFERLGPSSTTNLNQAFVDNAVLTTFEGIVIRDARMSTFISDTNYNIGILANRATGGYLKDISVENSVIDARVKTDLSSSALSEVNVGGVIGLVQTNSTTILQMTDVTIYQTSAKDPNKGSNNISIDLNGASLTETIINAGGLVGQTLGSVVATYTSASSQGSYTKGIGIQNSGGNIYTVGSNSYGLNVYGTKVALQGTGALDTFNGGVMFGKASTIRLAFNRASEAQKLQIVGGVVQEADALGEEKASIERANIGGIMGHAETSAAIQNSTSSKQKFIEVDAYLDVEAQVVSAGMLIGQGANIFQIDNIDTFGLISANAETEARIGGFVGTVSSDLAISNSISRTNLMLSSGKGYVGGLVGLYETSGGTLLISDGAFGTKYLGTISVRGTEIDAGGFVGAVKSTSSSSAPNVQIANGVFGGTISVSEITGAVSAGGLVGSAKTSGSEGTPQVQIASSLAYGDIKLLHNYLQNPNNVQIYVGGLLGKGSERTSLSSNASLVTLQSKTASTLGGVHINALVGEALGAKMGEGNALNYYSHQISLCLDLNVDKDGNNVIGATNLYYKRLDKSLEDGNPLKDRSLSEVISDFLPSLETSDYGLGTKLNPIEIINQADLIKYQSVITDASKEIFVLFGGPFTIDQSYSAIDLNNSHILGDGYEIINQGPMFGVVDESSSIAGILALPIIESATSSTFDNLYGIGVIANINNGFVFGSSVKTTDIAAHGHASLNVSQDAYIGGIVGVNNGVIQDSMASIKINASGKGGGVAGLNQANIISCYSVGVVNGGYSFSSGSGSVYGSYTSSLGSQGVFGSQTTSDTFYDIYATGKKDMVATAGSTDKMSVLDSLTLSQNLPQKLFFESDAQKHKFGYVLGQNFGYPTFSGSAYKNLSYMQGVETGTGAEGDPILVNSVGKLQQINTAVTKDLYYKLSTNISVTNDMRLVFDEEKQSDYFNKSFHVVNWEPITDFKGSLSGAYGAGNLEIYSIDFLTNDEDRTSWAIFGETTSATFENFKVEYTDLSPNAEKIGGLAISANNVSVKNVSIKANSISTEKTGSVIIGGMFAEATASSGDNTITNCFVQISSLGAGSVSGAYIGAVIGKMSETNGSTFLSNVEISAVTMEVEASGKTFMGGIVGSAQNLTCHNVSLESVTISALGTGEANLGGAFGEAIGFSTNFGSVNISFASAPITLTTNSTSSSGSNLGGLIGLAEDCQITSTENEKLVDFNSVKITMGSSDDMTLDGKLIAGGVIGQATGGYLSGISPAPTVTSYSKGQGVVGGIIGLMNEGRIESITHSASNNKFNFENEEGSGGIYVGALVGQATSEATLHNVSLTASGTEWLTTTRTDESFVGGFAGSMNLATVDGTSTINGLKLEGQNVGAVSGAMTDSKVSGVTISSCDITATYSNDATPYAYAGAVCGRIDGENSQLISIRIADTGSTRVQVENDSELLENKTPQVYLGGFAGKMSGSISGASSTSVEIVSKTGGYIGGAVGWGVGLKIDGLSTSGLVKADLQDKQEGQTLHIGGMVGHMQGGSITSSTRVQGTVTSNSEAYVGGLVGWAGDVSFSKNKVFGIIQELKTYKTSADTENTAVGGLAGYASSCYFKQNSVGCNVQFSGLDYGIGALIYGSYIAGGLVGISNNSNFDGSPSGGDGTFEPTDYNTNAAAIDVSQIDIASNPDTILPEKAYGGGIVGKATGGTLSVCKNFGQVTVGQKSSGDRKITQEDMFYYEENSEITGSIGDMDDENDQELTHNKIIAMVNEVNSQVSGSDESYAGGIAGTISGTVSISNVINSAEINAAAKAKITLHTSERYNPLTSWDAFLGVSNYDAYLHYGFEHEKAYAAGIVPSEVELGLGCQNSGAINGGGKIEFNMFSTDNHNTSNKYVTYVLGYSFDYNSEGEAQNAQSSFKNIYEGDEWGISAWVEHQEDAGIKLVASGKASNQYHYYGEAGFQEKLGQNDDGPIIKTAFMTEDDYAGVDTGELTFTYLHRDYLSSVGVVAGPRYIYYPYQTTTLSCEHDNIPVNYFVLDGDMNVSMLYAHIFKADYTTPPVIIEGEEVIPAQDVYYVYEPRYNADGTLMINANGTISAQLTEITYLWTCSNSYADVSSYEDIDRRYKNRMHWVGYSVPNYVTHFEGGKCDFPQNNNVDTKLYSYDLVENGSIYISGNVTGEGDEKVAHFELQKDHLQLLDLEVVYSKDQIDFTPPSITPNPDDGSFIWGNDIDFWVKWNKDDYPDDRGKEIWVYQYQRRAQTGGYGTTEREFLHYRSYSGSYALYRVGFNTPIAQVGFDDENVADKYFFWQSAERIVIYSEGDVRITAYKYNGTNGPESLP